MVGYCWKFFKNFLNLRALFNAQRSEPKSILRSKRPHNLRRDRLFARRGQIDFERDELFKREAVSDERIDSALAEITRPSVQADVLAAPLKANLNPLLEHVPGRDSAFRTTFISRRSCHLFLAVNR